MTEPIGPPPQQPSAPLTTPNVPAMSQQMYTQVEKLSELMQGLIQDRSNSTNPSHLQSFTDVVNQIHALVEKTQTL
ncbi:MAG: hypothetical protein V4492_03650 [Chlamydiota bacterium]